MGVGRTRAVAVVGIEGTVVDIEADVSAGLPKFILGGLPDTACKQAPDRILAACANSDLKLSRQRITVNMSPADLPKQGSGFDVAIALAALAAGGDEVDTRVIRDVVHLGELGLDGTVRPLPGVLPAVLAAAAAGVRTVVVPEQNAREAALVSGVEVVPVRDLADLVVRYRCLARGKQPPPLPVIEPPSPSSRSLPDLRDVVGQPEARYAVEVAAAGGHHMAMIGPPGAGKTMIAERLPGILPALTEAEALEVTAIHSVLGQLEADVLVRHPPFVAPHHGTSLAAMVGGGSGRIRPGAVSRAHTGILFLDESSNGKCTSFSKEVTDEDDYEAAWRERTAGTGDTGGGLSGVYSDGAGHTSGRHAADLSVLAAVEVPQGQGGCDRASAP
ncbi:ATP-binding protein [Metallococcus carri]|uniref:ATP-binding protein n=1 Tax=Metallococcus carri TaxID=1656884 RepID=UPI001F2103FA|nr:ATP-binding protein [Metallococcus carri]